MGLLNASYPTSSLRALAGVALMYGVVFPGLEFHSPTNPSFGCCCILIQPPLSICGQVFG